MKYAIQPRDKQILLRMYRWRFMTRQQIEQLFFPSKQTAKVRIEKLIRYGLISECNVLPSTPIFRLTDRGEALLKKLFQGDSGRFKFSRKAPDRRFLRHHIELNDFWGALIASNKNGIQCPLFLPYYLGTEGFERITRCQNIESVHDADGIFILSKDGQSQLFILEIDRGTQSISGALLDMVKFYQEFLVERNFDALTTRFSLPQFDLFRLLIVTSSRARAENIRKASLKIANRIPEALRFFWVTGVTIGPENIFEPIWESLDLYDGREYSLNGNQK